MFMNFDEQTLSVSQVYDGKVISVHKDIVKLPNGRISTREVVEYPRSVCIASLNENKELIFVEQFRYPYARKIIELPAGKLENGESPLEAAKREVKEEAGVIGINYKEIGILYPTPGYSNEIIHILFCRIKSILNNNPDEDEFLNVKSIPLDTAFEMVLNNEIHDAKTQIGVMKVYQYLIKNRL